MTLSVMLPRFCNRLKSVRSERSDRLNIAPIRSSANVSTLYSMIPTTDSTPNPRRSLISFQQKLASWILGDEAGEARNSAIFRRSSERRAEVPGGRCQGFLPASLFILAALNYQADRLEITQLRSISIPPTARSACGSPAVTAAVDVTHCRGANPTPRASNITQPAITPFQACQLINRHEIHLFRPYQVVEQLFAFSLSIYAKRHFEMKVLTKEEQDEHYACVNFAPHDCIPDELQGGPQRRCHGRSRWPCARDRRGALCNPEIPSIQASHRPISRIPPRVRRHIFQFVTLHIACCDQLISG